MSMREAVAAWRGLSRTLGSGRGRVRKAAAILDLHRSTRTTSREVEKRVAPSGAGREPMRAPSRWRKRLTQHRLGKTLRGAGWAAPPANGSTGKFAVAPLRSRRSTSHGRGAGASAQLGLTKLGKALPHPSALPLLPFGPGGVHVSGSTGPCRGLRRERRGPHPNGCETRLTSIRGARRGLLGCHRDMSRFYRQNV
jgi:hypothetical protein